MSVLRHIRSEVGLSLIEVLIGSLVFMVGFSILIAFLSSATEKISQADLIEAMNLAEEVILESRSGETVVEIDESERLRGEKLFRITKTIERKGNFVSVRVEVKRRNQRLNLADVYYEFQSPEE